jgi:hypothetical protein
MTNTDSLVTLKTLRRHALRVAADKAKLDAEVRIYLTENRGADYQLLAQALGVHFTHIYSTVKKLGITRKITEVL